MKILKEFTIIVGILFLSHIIHKVTNMPIPATVLGMILLLIFLLTGLVKLEQIETVSDFFLDNLTFLFVPGGVGLILSLDLLKDQWLPTLFILLFTTGLVMVVTGLTVQLIKGRKKEEVK